LGIIHVPLKIGNEGDERAEWVAQVRPDESAQS